LTDARTLEGCILAAGDDGARAALEPLLSHGARFEESLAAARALVAGTSQSDSGFAREAAARREAAKLGIPVACIEDFPGNYRAVPGAPTRLLVVEGEFSARLYRERLGPRCPALAVIPPARYDALRGSARNPGSRGAAKRVLWAGQPETRSCVTTLRAIAPFLRGKEIELLFRAHPRDAGHPAAYEGLGIRWRDVSAAPIEEIYRAPLDLVVTQYSSIALEAGFLGVPSVHVLLPDAGGQLLGSQKGYAVPMPCEAGASFLVRAPEPLDELERALFDTAARAGAIQRFRELYHADTKQAPRLIERVAGIIAR
jgi:hypothetical protein